MSDIKVRQMLLGPMDNFVYFVVSESTRKLVIIDPGWEAQLLVQTIQELNLVPVAILLTHGHYDHVNAIPEIQNSFPDLPVYFSKDELPLFTPKCSNIIHIQDGSSLNLLGTSIRCIGTPGHSPGGICFWIDDHLFTGDTLFIQGCGRCDLPGSDPIKMYQSLYEKLKNLPGHLTVYSGHNYGQAPFASLQDVTSSNPILGCKDQNQFLGRFY